MREKLIEREQGIETKESRKERKNKRSKEKKSEVEVLGRSAGNRQNAEGLNFMIKGKTC